MSKSLSFKHKLKLLWLIHTERIWRRYYYENTMRHWGYFVFVGELAKFLKDLFIGNWDLTFGSRYAYPYYDGEKKSKLRILLENMWWTLKYNEVNKYYYAYGFDNKHSDNRNYVAYSEFRVLRNILNIRSHENKQNTKYCFNYLCIPRDKFLFGQFCKSLGVPYPETYGITYADKIWWIGFGKENYTEINTEDLPDVDAFCKEVSGGGGRKAFSLKIMGGEIVIDGKRTDCVELKSLLQKERYIIQRRISQHDAISSIYPLAVNTIRLITVMDDMGEVHVFPSKMRFGAGGNRVDNCGQGGLSIGINSDKGTLMNVAYYNPGFGKFVTDFHPDTGTKFAEFCIPFYHEALTYAKRLHKALCGVYSIGWDIAITTQGPVFLEAGEDWELPMIQHIHGGLREQYYFYHGRSLDITLRSVH